jgi:hypothetical protein
MFVSGALMKKSGFLFLSSLLFLSFHSFSQDTIKQSSIHSIFDIPHQTLWQKWMWIHRSVTFMIIKEREPYFDTAYVKTYKKSVAITIPVSSRFLKFNLVDWASGNLLKYAPNSTYDLGFSVNSRWASFQLLTGVHIYENYKNQKGSTRYHDYQFNIYGSHVTSDIFYQNYKGFYIRNSLSYPGYSGDTRYSIRKDINAISFGVSSYYIFNSKKFSYRNSFAFTEVQKKSAGSFLAGTYFFLFNVTGDSSLVSYPFRPLFDSLAYLKNATLQTYGINIGYIHTFVFLKRFYTTISLVQGLGLEQTLYNNDKSESYSSPLKAAAKINCRYALGYNLGRFYIGTMGILDYFIFASKTNTTFNFNMGKLSAFVGYRFYFVKTERKILRKLNLIDYRL